MPPRLCSAAMDCLAPRVEPAPPGACSRRGGASCTAHAATAPSVAHPGSAPLTSLQLLPGRSATRLLGKCRAVTTGLGAPCRASRRSASLERN
eukprot:13033402-Alexandrium_andersonii.AAC.1